jgi:hypothetical protein
VPNATHSILGNYGDCVTGIIRQFLANPARRPDSRCTQGLTIPFVMP